MKSIIKNITLLDIVISLTLYVVLLMLFGWNVRYAVTSYSEDYTYGFPLPVVVKNVPTEFCPSPPCSERVVTYYFYDSHTGLSANLIYSIIVDAGIIVVLIIAVSYIRKKFTNK